jgi:hypothetical protein
MTKKFDKLYEETVKIFEMDVPAPGGQALNKDVEDVDDETSDEEGTVDQDDAGEAELEEEVEAGEIDSTDGNDLIEPADSGDGIEDHDEDEVEDVKGEPSKIKSGDDYEEEV